MRSASPLLAAGLALAVAGQALAAPPTTPAATDQSATTPPASASTPPATDAAPTAPPAATPAPATTPGATPNDTAAPAASGAGTNSSATAGATAKTAPPSFSVGEVVKDNTGAAIGTITELKGAGDQQMAVIKMGDQSFQVQSSKMGAVDGAAEINMTKAQIAGMLHTK